MRNLHPWNQDKALRLIRDRERLSHALLLAGQKGLGKEAFSEWLAQVMLCVRPEPDGQPCGHCQNCVLFVAGTHPDVHVVQPESRYKNTDGLLARYALRYPPEDKSRDSKESTVIRIDQIRALIANSQTRPQIAQSKVLILSPADSMNINASNSLLKLLEEPPPDSFLILVAHRPSRLSATIRSRCARLEFHVPDTALARGWLESQGVPVAEINVLLALAGGAPLEARILAGSGFLAQRAELQEDMEKLAAGQGDVLASAARWKGLGAERCLAWLQGWLADLAVLMLHGEQAHLRNADMRTRLQALEKRLHLKSIFWYAESVARNRNLLGGSLDEQLILEDTLINWTELRSDISNERQY
jgi:DNA polymerase-3 subunit delta'